MELERENNWNHSDALFQRKQGKSVKKESTDMNSGQVRTELEEARRQLASLMNLRNEAHVEQAADVMDQLQAAQAREFVLETLDRIARQVRQIENALERVDAGEYGVCVDCEEEIAEKRLRAVPWAERCLKCQEMFDRGAFGGDVNRTHLFVNAA